MDLRTRRKIQKAGRRTLLYLVVVTITVVVITPVYFITVMSFLSTSEAYEYPLPLYPAFSVHFKLERGKRGYLLSIKERNTPIYTSVLDTQDVDKMRVYMEMNLGIKMSNDDIQAQIQRLERSGQEAVYFTRRRSLLANYITFFKVTQDAVPALIRSLQIAALTILISLSIGGTAGYAFARYRFYGRDALKFSVLFVRMFPGVAIALPMVIILANMGLYDQPLGLSLIYSVGAIGMTVWITASIFLGIPISYEEAALVFGASRLRAFFNITLPLAFPGLAAAAMYAFIGAWNETVAAIILTEFHPTFSVVVYRTLLGATGQINLTAAGGIAMALPAVIFTFFIRRYIHQMWGGITI
ncbi:carbohydrate ABC transporter permease [Candidatus Parcubacteria bacterium]|nr:MAG: carbohydrate ABC transporter permease [Candidatus Parcubacteria bacterium]